MNLCFLIGKIISDVDFEFILQSKQISVALFKVQLQNNPVIEVKGFLDIADRCYSQFHKNDIVFIQGKVETDASVMINKIKKLPQGT